MTDWKVFPKAPPALEAGVEWWLDNPNHSEDVVMVAEDGMDALILSGFNDVEAVAWVDYEGTVRVLRGRFEIEHLEDEEEQE